MRARLIAGLLALFTVPTVLAADGVASFPLGDAQAGATKAAVCGACHGMDGNSVDPQYPKLAGQHAAYIARHLALYKSGERENAIMAGFATVLSEQDMLDLGAHFATLDVTPGIADESMVETGQRLYRGGDADRELPACIACHGPTGKGNPLVPYPAIAGQHAAYTADMLRRYRDGAVYGESAGSAVAMAAVAAELTDAEIEALASYLEGLHGG
jgi:cytochrome c553